MATKLATIIADFTTQLASELAVGGTTATLSSATDDDGVALPSGRYFFTIDAANSKKEHISCDLSGTALTNIKTVSRQGVETAGVLRKHRIGASIGITDFAHILQINALLAGTTDLNYLVPLKYDGTATISDLKHLATKAYVDGIAIAGSPDATTSTKGISKMSVAPVSAASPIAVGQNDPQFVNYFAETGAANAYVLTPSPSIGAYAVGQRFSFKATNANTLASTININALGTKTIKKLGGTTDLASGDIASGMIVTVEYDGTNFLMLNPVANAPVSNKNETFGNGIDGDVTISSNTSLTRDMYYNNLTINNTFTLSPKGFRIFVKGTLTCVGTGKIDSNGGSGGNGAAGGGASPTAGGTAGVQDYTTGSLPIPKAGQAGGGGSASGGTNGTAGVAATLNLTGNAASAGGNGAVGTYGLSPGTGGAAGATGTQPVSRPYSYNPAYNLYDLIGGTLTRHDIAPTGGSGASGGGANPLTNYGAGGGGSGSTGGVIWIAANTISTLNANANGGNGGNGGAGGGQGQGGGGSGASGGVIILIYSSATGITTSVAGGTAGTGAASGGAGSSGIVYTIQV